MYEGLAVAFMPQGPEGPWSGPVFVNYNQTVPVQLFQCLFCTLYEEIEIPNVIVIYFWYSNIIPTTVKHISILRFPYVDNSLHFNFADFPVSFIKQFASCFFWCLKQMLLSKFVPYYCFHYIIPRILHIISWKSWYSMQTKSWWWAIPKICVYLISRFYYKSSKFEAREIYMFYRTFDMSPIQFSSCLWLLSCCRWSYNLVTGSRLWNGLLGDSSPQPQRSLFSGVAAFSRF